MQLFACNIKKLLSFCRAFLCDVQKGLPILCKRFFVCLERFGEQSAVIPFLLVVCKGHTASERNHGAQRRNPHIQKRGVPQRHSSFYHFITLLIGNDLYIVSQVGILSCQKVVIVGNRTVDNCLTTRRPTAIIVFGLIGAVSLEIESL